MNERLTPSNIAEIAWPMAFVVVAFVTLAVSILLYRLIKSGTIKRFGGKVGEATVTVETESSPEGYDGPDRRTLDVRAIIHVTQLVGRRWTEAREAARVAQKAFSDEVEDGFWPIFTCDPWQIEAAWSRLHMVLYSAADRNHILEFVRRDPRNTEKYLVDDGYLDEKVETFRRRYEKLESREGCLLPAFASVEREVRDLIASVLVRFARIAEDEDDKLQEFCQAMKATTENEELKRIIDATAQRGSSVNGD